MRLYFKKFIIFLKKEDRKVCSLLFIIIKFFLSLFFTILLPILFLIIFIFKEPREIKSLNDYIDNKVKKIEVIKDFSYDSAKISMNKHFGIVYMVDNLGFKVNSAYVNFPKVYIRIKLLDILKGKFFLDNVEINDLISYFGYEGIDKFNINDEKKITKVDLNYEKVNNIFNNIVDYFSGDNTLFFNTFTVKNSTFYFYNKNIKNLDKVEVVESQMKMNKKFNSVALIFNLKTKINNRKENIESYNTCLIGKDKRINCETIMKNLSIYNVTNVFKKFPNVENYIKNVNGDFDVIFSIFLKNYTELEENSFVITSNSGNFNLRQFFGGNIYYKNFVAKGNITDNDEISLKNLEADLYTDEEMTNLTKFFMSSEFKNKNYLKLNFNVSGAEVDKLNIFWPVFLNDLGIRDWVVEHFKSGLISNANASLLLNYDENKKELKIESVDSRVNFVDTYLDYSELFPAVHNMNATAIFTDKDMNIEIKSAKVENTDIYNGKIYTDFTSPNPSLALDLESKGKAYELFYFVDNSSKETIKDVVNFYVNGDAVSKIKIDIPFVENLLLDSVLIDANVFVEKNNTFLFNNNSGLSIKLLKKHNSNRFNTTVDLKNSFMDFSIIDFEKKVGVDLTLHLDIDVFDTEVLLKNIRVDNKNIIDFTGDGAIRDGELKTINIDNIKYNKNNFNFVYNKENDININIIGNAIYVNKALNKDFFIKKESNKNNKNDTGDNEKIVFDINFNDLIFNKKYDFKNVNVNAELINSKLNNLSITSTQEYGSKIMANVEGLFDEKNKKSEKNKKEEENKYSVSAECSNLGRVLNDFNITDKLIGGDLYFKGFVDKNDNLSGDISLKNDFNIVTKELKDKNFFNYIMNSEIVNEKIKKDLMANNTMNLAQADAEIRMENNVLTVKKLLVESGNFFGVGISGNGKYYVESEKIDFEGLIAPLGKLNTLFGANKIPVLNKLLFGKDNAGLFTIGYTLKTDENGKISFNIVPISVMNSNSLKNLFLMLLLI